MTAEELKGYVRQYADEHAPGWTSAGVLFHVGEVTSGLTEKLLVLPGPTPQSPPPPPPASS